MRWSLTTLRKGHPRRRELAQTTPGLSRLLMLASTCLTPRPYEYISMAAKMTGRRSSLMNSRAADM